MNKVSEGKKKSPCFLHSGNVLTTYLKPCSAYWRVKKDTSSESVSACMGYSTGKERKKEKERVCVYVRWWDIGKRESLCMCVCLIRERECVWQRVCFFFPLDERKITVWCVCVWEKGNDGIFSSLFFQKVISSSLHRLNAKMDVIQSQMGSFSTKIKHAT